MPYSRPHFGELDVLCPWSRGANLGNPLLDLPEALIADIASRAARLGACGALSLTCTDFSKTNLLHAPALHIQLDSQGCDQLLTPRVVAALQARTCKLALTLEQQQAQHTRQYIMLLTSVLKKLASCAAVEACKLGTVQGASLSPHKTLGCSPKLVQHLMDSFPSLTSLSLHGYAIPCSGLASLLAHPQLSLHLQQLDLTGTTITQPKRPEPGAATLVNLFHASRLKQLRLLTKKMAGEGRPLLPNLQPLSSHLTQLCIQQREGMVWDLVNFTAALQPLAQLQVLTISGFYHLGGLPGLLQVLPQLHTLQLPDAIAYGQEQSIDALLAATQLTSIQLSSCQKLHSSRADVPCSWQRLELTGYVDCAIVAHLPLHSLTQPLVLNKLFISSGSDDCAVVAAAVHNLTQACSVPVRIKALRLCCTPGVSSIDMGDEVETDMASQVELQQLVAVLQVLKHCSWGRVFMFHMNVGVALVLTLAPLCQGVTQLDFAYGSLTPSLEFWRQLVLLMPTVTNVVFRSGASAGVEGEVVAGVQVGSGAAAEVQGTVRWLKVARAALKQFFRCGPVIGRSLFTPAMVKRRRHSDAFVDGVPGPSPTIGTPLLDLPEALIEDIASRAARLGAGSALSLTCRAISKANLMHAPALHIQLDSQGCDQLLTPRVVAALQARTCKLALTLEQQQAQHTRQYIMLLTKVLKKLASCAAVEACKLGTVQGPSLSPHKTLSCSPKLAQHLMDSFPSLTSLSLHSYVIPCSGLATLLAHPQLSLHLQQLDLTGTTITQPKRLEPGAVTLANLFHASRLKHLSLSTKKMAGEDKPRMPNLQPLSQHLTQLCIQQREGKVWGLGSFTAALQPLSQLQVLTMPGYYELWDLPGLLQALPQLHTLQLPDADGYGQGRLNTLLAATQLTSMQLDSLAGLRRSCADVPCSWQRLELTGYVDCATVAHLPLHSLTQPLVMGRLSVYIGKNSPVAAAVHNLTRSRIVQVRIKELQLYNSDVRMAAQQREHLQQVVAVLQALHHCSWEVVSVERLDVGVADVSILAPLCQGVTQLEFAYGSLTPSLDFWRQLVLLMPTVTGVVFRHVCMSTSSAMHQSLQLMADQPWARWLDICISLTSCSPELPACWLADNPSKPGKLRVWFKQGWSGASAGVEGEVEPGVQVGSGAAAEVQGTVRWLKVARAALKQAPGSRLKVKALCRQLLQQVQERHSGPGGVTLTRAHVAAVLHRKAAANKLVMTPDGFVSLPQPRATAANLGNPLLELPEALISDIASRAARLGACGALSLTCSDFSKTNLMYAPALHIQLVSQRCDQLLTPRVVAALQARTCKLALTLEQQQAQHTRQYIMLLTDALKKLASCPAVEACKLGTVQGPSLSPYKRLGCSPTLAQHLMDSFPSLTSLSLHGYAIPCSGLASLLAHPHLSLQLQQLNLTGTIITQPKRPEPGAATLDNLFHASRLKQLRLLTKRMAGEDKPLLPNLQPLSQHLTQLCIQQREGMVWDLDEFTATLQPLAQLQVLTFSGLYHLGGLPGLLQVLPQLHTLQLPDAIAYGQEQSIDALLAATQLTSIQLSSCQKLRSSRADVPCSWHRLELTGYVDCASVAQLPLHSLCQPLVLNNLFISSGSDDCALVAAAVHNLTQACKVPVRIKALRLCRPPGVSRTDMGDEVETDMASQVELQQLVAVLQALKHCSWGRVFMFHMNVGVALVLTLAPLCQGVTQLDFAYGSLTPSLEFWRQLVLLMPTVTDVVFTMVKRRRHSDATVDGVPVQATSANIGNPLLELPEALISDIASRAARLGACGALSLTCTDFSKTNLMYAPALHILLDSQGCDQLLTPRVVAALQARTCKLAMTLEQQQAQHTRQYIMLLTNALKKLASCAAVEACKLGTVQGPSLSPHKTLSCSPKLAQHLMDSFPSLTSLSLHGYAIPCSGLASLLAHPHLSLQLQQLDLGSTTITQPKRPEPGAATLVNLFYASRLKQLSLLTKRMAGENRPLLPNLQPLSQHLTQLCIQQRVGMVWELDDFTATLQPLAQLQVLTISGFYCLGGLPDLLEALPQLHTLQLPDARVSGQEQLDMLLAATQLTSIKLSLLEWLDISRADVPCSWQRLELTGRAPVALATAAYLPLHSLTQPLVLARLITSIDTDHCTLVAAAIHNLTQACKVPVRIKELCLHKVYVGMAAHQRVQYQQLVAVLQALKHCSWDMMSMNCMDVGPADVVTLAPLCQGCTHLKFRRGSLTPSLEFWHQLVQLMPTVTNVVFKQVEESTSLAMHESLQLMAEQPWARWLDVCISRPLGLSMLPACWLADNPSKPRKLRAGPHSCVGAGASAGVEGEVVAGVQVGSGAAAEVQGTVRWLKVARAALKQAPGSRLKVKALCCQLLQQVQERHSGPGGVTLTRAHVAAVLQRKAAANKLVMTPDGFVSLPLPRCLSTLEACRYGIAGKSGVELNGTRHQEEHGEALEDQQQEEEQQQEEQQQWSRAGGKQSRDWSERKRVEDQHWTALNKCMRRSYISDAPQMEECYSHKRMLVQSSLQSSVDAAWSSHACCGVAGSCQQESLQPRDSLPAEYVDMNYRAPSANLGNPLLELPEALIEDIAFRAARLGAGGALSLTCPDFSKTNLLHAPALHIQLDSQGCDQLLTPRVVAALQARTCKLALTLEQQQAQHTRQYIMLLTKVLKKLASCAAVEACKLGTVQGPSLSPHKTLSCSPKLAQHLMDSFPSLTSLSLHGYAIPCSGLASLLAHPQLSLHLQQLDLSSTTITQPKRPEPGAATLDNLFHVSMLKQLSLSTKRMAGEDKPLLPNLQPLSQHLTQLCIQQRPRAVWELDDFTAALQPLAQLQVLTISGFYRLGGLPDLLEVLPQLHTLQLPDARVSGHEELDTLLAATQLTSLQLSSQVWLSISRADVPCSWQRLELTGRAPVALAAAAYLPLHSLTQPLVLARLITGIDNDPCTLVAAAVHNLTQACQVPVRINELCLHKVYVGMTAHQRKQYQQLVAVLQALKHCSWDMMSMNCMDVGPADVATLAPLCHGCTHLKFRYGSLTPSLEFWHQLVQLMPTVTNVVFKHVEESTSLAMHESLQLMAEQPWARWLDICISRPLGSSELPACWLADNPSKPGKLRLDLTGTTITQPKRPEPGAATLVNLFHASRLKQLRLLTKKMAGEGRPLLPNLQPLSSHLTQLCIQQREGMVWDLINFTAALQPLAQLQVLTISGFYHLGGLPGLLQVLPQLHTLQLPDAIAYGHDQSIDALLAATQLTSIQLSSCQILHSSRADVPCSWQQLELTGYVDCAIVAHLPLHSLTQPLVLNNLFISSAGCTHLEFAYGSVTPSLEFWRQLVQLMPAVTDVVFAQVEGRMSSAMC
ncbi:hypothetical protein QJQ45_024890 [Haematococcus lacustris]|nr:hypothetical protein QJQ45_024890 [Haematococcus lacustris]